MRRIMLFTLAVGVVGGGALWHDFDPEERRAAIAEAAAARDTKAALARMLTARTEHDFVQMVPGPMLEPDIRDFRGTVMQDGARLPVFGRAAYTCEAKSPDPSCWKIVSLMIDGEAHELSRDRFVPTIPPLDRASEVPQDGSAGLVKGTTPEASAQVPDEPQPSVGFAEPTPLEPIAPRATHRVRADRGNARSGPGTDWDVVTTLPLGTELALVEENAEGWGKFRVLASDAPAGTVWMALRIVEPAS